MREPTKEATLLHQQHETSADLDYFVYAIKDEAAAGFGAPIIDANKRMLLRRLGQTLSDDRNPAAKYPQDHSVWELGRFNHRNGMLTPHAAPKFLGSCAQFKETFDSIKE